MSIFAKYNHYLSVRPLTTKILTSGTICAFGDVLCQAIENRQKKTFTFDVKRVRTFFLWGALVVAPTLHLCYARIFPWLVPELTMVGGMKKLFLD